MSKSPKSYIRQWAYYELQIYYIVFADAQSLFDA